MTDYRVAILHGDLKKADELADEFLAALVDNGVTTIEGAPMLEEVSGRSVRNLLRKRLDQAVRSGALTVPVVHGTMANLSPLDEAARRKAVASEKRVIEVSAPRYGSRMVILHPGKYAEKPEDRQTHYDQLRRSLEELLHAAEGHDVTLAVENMPVDRGISSGRRIGGEMEPLREIVDEFDTPRLGLCFDTGHANTVGPVDGWIRCFGDKLIHAHIHDNFGTGRSDDHLLPEWGTVNWDVVMQELREVDFRGLFMIESVAPPASHLTDVVGYCVAFYERRTRAGG